MWNGPEEKHKLTHKKAHTRMYSYVRRLQIEIGGGFNLIRFFSLQIAHNIALVLLEYWNVYFPHSTWTAFTSIEITSNRTSCIVFPQQTNCQ